MTEHKVHRTARKPGEVHMRIGTWNVEYGVGARNPDRLALLTAHAADIWVLTETHRDLNLSGTHMPVSSKPRPSGKEGSTWVTIWSRFPLVRLLEVPDSCRMVAALFNSPQGPIAVAGVVLPWMFDKGDDSTNPNPSIYEELGRVLRDEIPPLLAELRSTAPEARRVLAGDFNLDLAPPCVPGLKQERLALTKLLADEALVCHTAEVRYPTFSVARTLIDHICTDLGTASSWDVWSGKDGKRPRLSDHPGVVVTFAD